jgi:hypothetical protein
MAPPFLDVIPQHIIHPPLDHVGRALRPFTPDDPQDRAVRRAPRKWYLLAVDLLRHQPVDMWAHDLHTSQVETPSAYTSLCFVGSPSSGPTDVVDVGLGWKSSGAI